jgi:hypothetical protein
MPESANCAEPEEVYLRYYFPDFYGVLATEATNRLRALLPEYRQDYFRAAFDIMDLDLEISRQIRASQETFNSHLNEVNFKKNNPATDEPTVRTDFRDSRRLDRTMSSSNSEKMNSKSMPKQYVESNNASIKDNRKSDILSTKANSTQPDFHADQTNLTIDSDSLVQIPPHSITKLPPSVHLSDLILCSNVIPLSRVTGQVPQESGHIVQESNHDANLFQSFDMPDKPSETSGETSRNGLDHLVESPDPEDRARLDPLLGHARTHRDASAHRESRTALASYRLRRNLFPPAETPQRAIHSIVPTCGRARRTYQLSYIGLKQESCVQVFFSHFYSNRHGIEQTDWYFFL